VFRKLINTFADYFVRTSPGLRVNRGLYALHEYFRFRRSLYEHQKAQQTLEAIFEDLTVRAGPMAGLKYPSFSSVGSSLFPKLAGTYESELVPIISRLNTRYEVIIDIGCAEGYYAVGLARMFAEATVVAFDADESARNLCYAMAVINKVDDQVQIRGECTSEWIAALDRSLPTLIVCDCEGCERYLFDQNNIDALKNADLIVELHPMYQPDVREFLTNLFGSSHHIQFVSSHDDKRKISDLPSQYGSLSEIEKLKMVQEGRSFSMDWLIAKSIGS
jgi:hypothetical protein